MPNWRIVIPTHRRAHSQPTYDLMVKNGFSPTLVVHDEHDVPEGCKNFVVKKYPGGIRESRQSILEMFDEPKILMFDDDLRFYERNALMTNRYDKTNDIRGMMSVLHWRMNEYPLVGVHEKFMSQNSPEKIKIAGRMLHVTCWNRRLWKPGFKPQYRLHTGEDHDFHLQFLTTGHTSVLLTDWAQDDKEGAPGGCSEWRGDPLEDVPELAAMWPDYVRINPKNGRPTIFFKKAWKDGQRHAS